LTPLIRTVPFVFILEIEKMEMDLG